MLFTELESHAKQMTQSPDRQWLDFYAERTGTKFTGLKNRLKKSRRFKDAYITQDYAQAIQMERKVLIKAMFLAREKGADAKVRKLIIGDNTFHVNNIPKEFRPPPTVPAVGQVYYVLFFFFFMHICIPPVLRLRLRSLLLFS